MGKQGQDRDPRFRSEADGTGVESLDGFPGTVKRTFNRRYMSGFDPDKRFIRIDPCDSQDGEAETDERGLDSNEFDKTDKTFVFEKL